jgi:hypothetical protein
MTKRGAAVVSPWSPYGRLYSCESHQVIISSGVGTVARRFQQRRMSRIAKGPSDPLLFSLALARIAKGDGPNQLVDGDLLRLLAVFELPGLGKTFRQYLL